MQWIFPIHQSIAQASKQPYVHAGGFRKLIFPGMLRKMKCFSFKHNSFPVQLKAPTGQPGLDQGQTVTVTFKVGRLQHGLVYSKYCKTVKPLCLVHCSVQTVIMNLKSLPSDSISALGNNDVDVINGPKNKACRVFFSFFFSPCSFLVQRGFKALPTRLNG